jgi:hypothetical protein
MQCNRGAIYLLQNMITMAGHDLTRAAGIWHPAMIASSLRVRMQQCSMTQFSNASGAAQFIKHAAHYRINMHALALLLVVWRS